MIKLKEKDSDTIRQLVKQKTLILNQLYEVLGNIRLEENEWWLDVRNKYKLQGNKEYTVKEKKGDLFLKEVPEIKE